MDSKQFSTFFVANRLYGIEVVAVQEITKQMQITPVPLAPSYVYGLINLRGQIATAIGLRELFEIKEPKESSENMCVICKGDGLLLALVVDKIGDVVDAESSNFEQTPNTISQSVSCFMNGVYKTPGFLLSVLDVKKIIEVLNK